MLDFYEGWDLRARLMQDGYLPTEDTIEDGKEMMQYIVDLAREHYNWKPAEPVTNPSPTEEYAQYLSEQTPIARLNHIYGIAIDWDGARTIRGLGALIDEIIACTLPPCKSEHDALEEVKLTKMFNGVEDFLNTRVDESKLPFTWNFDGADVHKVINWCVAHDYAFSLHEPNLACKNHDEIGWPITIKKEVNA